MQIGDEFIYSYDNDILEVRIRTNNGQTYHKDCAPIKNKKKMNKLLKTLEEKGVIFGTKLDWFD